MARAITSRQSELALRQMQVSSGNRRQVRSEGIADAADAAAAKRGQALDLQWKRNAEAAKTWLQVSEGRIQECLDVSQRVRELAIMATDAGKMPIERIHAAEEVDGLLENLAAVANTRYGDRYLFGGLGGVAPVSVDRDESGRIASITVDPKASGQTTVQVSESSTLPVGAAATGPDGLFGNAEGRSFFDVLIDVRNALMAGQAPPGELVAGVEQASDNVADRLVSCGLDQARLEQLGEHYADRAVLHVQRLSDLQDTDLAEALTDISRLEAALEASIQMTVRIQGLSLVSFL
jgi:flagellar hook-associated protein 3 FlgL